MFGNFLNTLANVATKIITNPKLNFAQHVANVVHTLADYMGIPLPSPNTPVPSNPATNQESEESRHKRIEEAQRQQAEAAQQRKLARMEADFERDMAHIHAEVDDDDQPTTILPDYVSTCADANICHIGNPEIDKLTRLLVDGGALFATAVAVTKSLKGAVDLLLAQGVKLSAEALAQAVAQIGVNATGNVCPPGWTHTGGIQSTCWPVSEDSNGKLVPFIAGHDVLLGAAYDATYAWQAYRGNPIVIFFGGSNIDNIQAKGPDPYIQSPIWTETINPENVFRYPGSKYEQAQTAVDQYIEIYGNNLPTIAPIGYSSGADSAAVFAYLYTRAGGTISDLVILGGTMTGGLSKKGDLSIGFGDIHWDLYPEERLEYNDQWQDILISLLENGTDIYVLNDAGINDKDPDWDSFNNRVNTLNLSGEYTYDFNRRPHYMLPNSRPTFTEFRLGGAATNRARDVVETVFRWMGNR